MKFLYSLISVLIAAVILNSAIAEEENRSQWKYVRAPRTASLGESFDDRIRRKCAINGGPTAYEEADYSGSPRRWLNCVDSFMNITQFKAEFVAAVLLGEQNNVIQNYCNKLPTFRNCSIHVINSIKPCLHPEERDSFDILVHGATLAFQFACDNKDNVSNFIAAEGLECFASKYPDIQTRCAQPTFTLSNYSSVTVVIPGIGILPKLSLDLTGCTQIEEYSTCVVGEMKTCENQIPANVVERMRRFIINHHSTYCKTLLTQQTTGN